MQNESSTAALARRDQTLLRKPNEMIVMIPKSSRVTMVGRKIYNSMLHIAQAKMGSLESMPSADFVFEAPLSLILRSTGSGGEDRTIAKKYIKEMMSLTVDWESTAQGEGVKWIGFNMLAQASIEIRGGENWVSWSYPPVLMKALRDPITWTRVDLNTMAVLGTYAAVPLYEICARYKDNPSGLTCRKPVSWWANALSHTPAGAEKREWRKFKNERVNPAIDEINRETDLEIEMIEFKEGRVITEVQFSVRKKKAQVRPTNGSPVDVGLVLRAETLGIREVKLELLINEFGEDAVRAQIEVLERIGSSKHVSQVNRFAELKGRLRGQPTAGGVDAFKQQAMKLTADPKPELRETEDAARAAQIRAEILALDEQVKRELGQRAAAVLSSKGMLSAVVKRRLEQGDILHGLLGATVVQLYQESV